MSNLDFENVTLESSEGRLFFVLTPLSCDKTDVYKYFVKHSEYIQNNHYLVTIDKGENGDQIDYDSFLSYENNSNGKYFFIDNIRFFMYYNIEFFNKANVLIFLISIGDLLEVPFNYILDNLKVNVFYPNNLCLDVNLEYRKVNTNLYKKQLAKYKSEYLKYIKEKESRNLSIAEEFKKGSFSNPANYLNVYYDKVIPSLESVSLESALERAPKFKGIFLELLLKNKKRHLIHMVDNKYGMEPFTVIYNKLNTKVELITIKSSDDYDQKYKKLTDFNKDNSPRILLTDYIFTEKMTPKNINVYHLTDGGHIENLYSIFDHIKKLNNFSSQDKNFTVLNHVASTLKGELTSDNIKEIDFSERLARYSVNYNKLKKDSIKTFLEGTVIKIKEPEM